MPLTKEKFFEWKEARRIRKEKEAAEKKKEDSKKSNAKGAHHNLTGRGLF